MFILKKLISLLIMPTTLLMLLLIATVVLVWLKRFPRLTKIAAALTLLLFLLLAYGIPTTLVVRAIEGRNPPFPENTKVEKILVLGGGYTRTDKLPQRFHLNPASLARVVEGVRIWRLNPDAKLVFLGKGIGECMKNTALGLGVPETAIVVEENSRDTADQAIVFQKELKDKPFALVTSALHMPRSLALFRKAGLEPIPAPANFTSKPGSGYDYSNLFPGGFKSSHAAAHEVIGLVWSKLRGQI